MTLTIPDSPKNKQAFSCGEVALVGAGPGDPDLLTLQAFRFIKQAEVVIYDRLVSAEILALLPEDCQRIYVGKKQAEHRVPQDNINQLLVDYAKQNKKVLRLKGGDPFVFGRGGEEAQFSLKNGIACHIVPGMTAASACTSYVGIPLTHRQVAQSCTFITGNVQDNGELSLPWHTLNDNKQTVVFYMGIKSLPIISDQLIKAGRKASTPAALIYKGTNPEQQVYRGTLAGLNHLVELHDIKPPTLVIIGDVINTFDEKRLMNLGYLSPE
ncbi:uroporphyrinogen-III C-methyltransferase [Colwellia hornerae]|uniref:uroporphyrinogen-III C-methyltransferase n=1 Tax=Colwellia hornerae TaxID=89402 RepID=A0A5C6QDD6_9GAMM|nr:uroporphyrinogen-III C-methyltransferase [Colwellia hornerae]TWX51713.1 uroporphyrinogen-III C-methyltransferase [Colwellia hornerae]TWX57501.1 uroporphyrinogen-III C-methyltransferase [Colwellia hornerae]TWX67004.1 uroporphyrinogen-III C-methyltransferase [Colwellia hornerae]